ETSAQTGTPVRSLCGQYHRGGRRLHRSALRGGAVPLHSYPAPLGPGPWLSSSNSASTRSNYFDRTEPTCGRWAPSVREEPISWFEIGWPTPADARTGSEACHRGTPTLVEVRLWSSPSGHRSLGRMHTDLLVRATHSDPHRSTVMERRDKGA